MKAASVCCAMTRKWPPRVTRSVALAITPLLLGACATTLNTSDVEATVSAAITATPNAAAQRTITNFTQSLRCMDDKLLQYGIENLLIGVQEVTDLSNEVSGTKDMLLTALSTMSRKSEAFGIVTLSQDLQDVTVFHTYHGEKKLFQAPDYFIRLSSPQIDEGVQVAQAGGGFGIQGIANAESSRDRIASIVSLDLNLGQVKNLQLLPGVYSSNSIAVVRKGQAIDVAGEIRKMGALFRISNDNSEGFHHSVRTLIELSSIELIGRLMQIPYWECLDIESTNPAVQAQVQDWYSGLDERERLLFVQGKLEALRHYDGPVDGVDRAELHTAIAAYKFNEGLVADGAVDFLLYYHLVLDPTPMTPGHLELLRSEVRGDEGRLFTHFENQVLKDGGSLSSGVGVPLVMRMTTSRGVDPVVYRVGEEIHLNVEVTTTVHVYCYYKQGDGVVVKIFPNRYRPNSRVAAGTTLKIPGPDDFQIVADQAGRNERLMCLASYDEIDSKLPFPLREKDLQPIPIQSLDKVHLFYRSVAMIAPLHQKINVEVFP